MTQVWEAMMFDGNDTRPQCFSDLHGGARSSQCQVPARSAKH